MLRDFQSTFRSDILHDEGLDGPWTTVLQQLVDEKSVAAPDRLNIYRNNTLSLLSGLLELIFPVVRRLVGEAPFAYTAQNFIRMNPPTVRVLHKYGAVLPEFLKDFGPAQSLKYLPDVAAFEWALHEVFYEQDAALLSLEDLSQIAPEKIVELRFERHPAARLITSPYPIEEIWRVNQPEVEKVPQVELGAGGNNVIVVRPEFAVSHGLLTNADYAFAEKLCAGETLGAALAHVSSTHTDFDLQHGLAQLFSLGAFSRVVEDKETTNQ